MNAKSVLQTASRTVVSRLAPPARARAALMFLEPYHQTPACCCSPAVIASASHASTCKCDCFSCVRGEQSLLFEMADSMRLLPPQRRCLQAAAALLRRSRKDCRLCHRPKEPEKKKPKPKCGRWPGPTPKFPLCTPRPKKCSGLPVKRVEETGYPPCDRPDMCPFVDPRKVRQRKEKAAARKKKFEQIEAKQRAAGMKSSGRARKSKRKKRKCVAVTTMSLRGRRLL